MIIDKLTEFADSQAVAGAAATRNVGDVVNLFAPNAAGPRDVGQGQPVYLIVAVEAAPTGADTVKFQLASDSTNPLQTDGTQSIHLATDDIAIANLPAGTTFAFALPNEGGVPYEKWLGFQVVNVGASPLADLVVSAFLSFDNHGWRPYPGVTGVVA